MAERGKYPSEQLDHFIVRMPDGMRDRMKSEAKANNRSMNAEIVARLEAGSETLRDRFAMAAISGIANDCGLYSDEAAAKAYELADAMLLARQPNPPTSPDKES